MEYTKEEIAEALSGITKWEWSDALAQLDWKHGIVCDDQCDDNCAWSENYV